jgi:hypothetical protein
MHPMGNLEDLRHWRFGDQPSLFVLFPLAFACQLTRTCAANIQYGPSQRRRRTLRSKCILAATLYLPNASTYPAVNLEE